VSKSYLVPSRPLSCERVVQRSRFIAQAVRVESREQANRELHRIRSLHPKANHVCYGYIAGCPDDPQSLGFSDDGEPGGTAGKPILNVLQHSGLGEILVAVVRYFGGIQLGTGGLVRAYSGATKNLLLALECERYEQTSMYSLRCSYADESQLRHGLAVAGIRDFQCHYGEKVEILLPLSETGLSELRHALGFTQVEMGQVVI